MTKTNLVIQYRKKEKFLSFVFFFYSHFYRSTLSNKRRLLFNRRILLIYNYKIKKMCHLNKSK